VRVPPGVAVVRVAEDLEFVERLARRAVDVAVRFSRDRVYAILGLPAP
jgi:hypothetical protein